jgi:PAS domain S-box-containing protein
VNEPVQNAPSVVLVVDDNQVNLQIIGKVLERHTQCETVFLMDGSEVMDAALKHHPSLILLDVMMPNVNGYDACRQLKEHPDTRHIPVIFITAKTDTKDVLEGFKVGAVDYITKPFRAAELTARVNTHLDLAESSRLLQQQSSEIQRSEVWFKALFREAPVSIFIHDKDSGEIIDANPHAYTRYGLNSVEELQTGQFWMEPPYSAAEALALIRKTATEGPQTVEWMSRDTLGHIFWERLNLSVISLDGRDRVLVVGIEITDRKEAETRLLHQQRRLAGLLELPQKSDELSEIDFMQHGQELAEDLTGSEIAFIHFVNDDEKTIELVTWSRRTLHKYCKASYATHYPIDQAGIWADALRQRQPIVVNDYLMYPGRKGLPTGHSILRRLISVPVMEEGRVVMLAGVGNKPDIYTPSDIDSVQVIANAIWQLVQRKRGIVALQTSEARYRALFNGMQEGFALFEAVSNDDENTRTYRLLDANQAFQKVTGLQVPEVIGQFMQEMAAGWETETGSLFDDVLKEEAPLTLEFRSQALKRYLRITAFRPQPGQVACLCEDITERKALEQEREQMQTKLMHIGKMEAVGQLAAGIAHEINNPVQFINDNTTFTRTALQEILPCLQTLSKLPETPADPAFSNTWSAARKMLDKLDLSFLQEEIPAALDQTLTGIQRVKRIVNAMREFSYPDSEERALIDVHANIENTINVTRNIWEPVAEMEYRLAADLPKVLAFSGTINQALANLLINAAQAIQERIDEQAGEKGTITVTTAHVADRVTIDITDTGNGIPENIQHRVFDAFFTTKEIGRGTGQGLAIAHNIIVKEHGGELHFTTETGKGTTFHIALPAATTKSDAPPSARA